jgi:IclR family transcriptional regulator, KDG regulon repressor
MEYLHRVNMANTEGSVQSIERGFEILELLRIQGRPIGISEMANLLGLSTTTVHRLLKTLRSCRAVQQDPQTHLYDLNDHMLLYGKAVLNRFNFLGSVHPILGELSKRVGETVFMGILDDHCELIYIDQVDSLDYPLRMTPQIGLRQPAHSTSLGKVLLASLDEEKLAPFLSRGTYPRKTEFTITTAKKLSKELEKIRKAGYALDQEEMENGICCVAAPIKNTHGTIAAISISGPSSRMRSKGLDSVLSKEICSTATRVSEYIQSMDLGR